ncbi:proprotein convertase subtilisin/kexin type 5-like [Actinia tenebrosa]|uniref:Proprotein convertase subtilisin/kexin type 5-like n=1 Tax=Actinia tenebrosa TaxID=6105 RepID=A0A6P8I706_ACTTE|nr:proprotein convertase subtilisin/kexin type 5-like [Actinia tenebrosa]
MSKTLIFFLALSLIVVVAQCKHGGSYNNDWDDDGSASFDDDDDDWDDSGSGWSFNRKKDFIFPRRHHVKHQFRHWNNNRQVIHLKNCYISNCMKCRNYNCWHCMPGFRLKRQPFALGKRCVPDCPFGKRDANGTCQNNVCQNVPNCEKCQKFPWNRSCLKCKNGWHRFKPRNQMIAQCVSVCPRGYRATNDTLNPTCQEIPSFCYNAPRCLKCDKFPWTRSCLRCKDGWYRYKTPNQIVARCLQNCPRGYQTNTGALNLGSTCERIPSFCHELSHCDECPGFPWPRSCRRCETSWYRYKPPYHKTIRCIRTCPRGYQATNGTRKFGPTCKRIPSFCSRLRHCKECPDTFPLPRSCKKCKDGWYRYIAPYQLTAKCIKKCPRGYQVTNGTSDTGPTCEEIQQFCHDIPHCKDCQGPFWPSSCDRCEEGWYRYENPPSQISATCVQDCPLGFQATNSTGLLGPTCEKSQSKCPFMPGCESCPKTNVCLKCEANMIVFEGIVESKCVYKCPKGFDQSFKNGVSVCVAEEGCFDKLCFTCKKGWYKLPHQRRVCHRDCPPGYFKYLGSCIKCISGCTKCKNVFKCEKCDSGMAKLTSSLGFGERCVLGCPRGYTRELVNNTSYECRKVCRDKNCENCESVSYHGAYHCDYCKPGFHKIHRNLRDKCVGKCPSGYSPEKDVIEGSVCRKEPDVESTLNPSTDDVPTTYLIRSQPPP